MKLPEIDLKELERIKKANFKERLEFQDWYVRWLKMSSNAKWSAAQKALIDRKSVDSTKKSGRKRSSTRALRAV